MRDDLDPDSPVPLYRQLAEKLRQRIAAEQLTRLPSWRTLGQEYGVSRPTIEDAVAILKDAGEVFVVNGKGTFVASRPAELRGRTACGTPGRAAVRMRPDAS